MQVGRPEIAAMGGRTRLPGSWSCRAQLFGFVCERSGDLLCEKSRLLRCIGIRLELCPFTIRGSPSRWNRKESNSGT
jgi:hypothetical protein